LYLFSLHKFKIFIQLTGREASGSSIDGPIETIEHEELISSVKVNNDQRVGLQSDADVSQVTKNSEIQATVMVTIGYRPPHQTTEESRTAKISEILSPKQPSSAHSVEINKALCLVVFSTIFLIKFLLFSQ
jgi:hypothetical protein